MSNQPSVSSKRATCGAQDAARAYHAMDGLMKGVRDQQYIPSAGNTRWTDAETKMIKAILATFIIIRRLLLSTSAVSHYTLGNDLEQRV